MIRALALALAGAALLAFSPSDLSSSRTPVADRAMLEASVGAGFRAIKIKIGERSGQRVARI